MIWDDRVEDAFRLWIARKLRVEQIAIRCDCTPKTIWNWRQDPEWKRREAEHLEMVREETRRIGLATREGRIQALQSRYNALAQIVRQRAKAAKEQKTDGESTGWIRKGALDRPVFDANLAREMRAIAREIAIELGQWQEKAEAAGFDVAAAAKAIQESGENYPGPDDSEPDK